MHPILRIFGIASVFVLSTIAWMILGASTSSRATTQQVSLSGQVSELWGRPQQQPAPALTFHWTTTREETRTEQENGRTKLVKAIVTDAHQKPASPASSDIDVALHLDRRLKGLIWYALYDVTLQGKWTYLHTEPEAGQLAIQFAFPDPQGIYDDFQLLVDGQPRAEANDLSNGAVETTVPVAPGQEISVQIRYKSRGMDQWSYQPSNGVASLRNFHLRVTTDFEDIDFAPSTMSPSSKTERDHGWTLDWSFERVVTGRAIGLSMPTPIQPGELASALSFSAPISLFFFFLIIFVLAALRGLEVHPINYLFLAGAFFSFHLLFAYSVDHLEVIPAFVLSSGVTMALVVSYLRLVVSNRFAFLEAAAAQLVYLIGFSLAHFWEGYTGLTVTVLSIVTLALLMQLTGRVRWSELLSRSRSAPGAAPSQAPG